MQAANSTLIFDFDGLILDTENPEVQIWDRTWRESLQRLGKILGKTKPVITLPKALVKLGAWFVALMHRLQGRESGLDLVPFVELQTRLAFLDLDYSARALGYAHAELEPDFVNTVQASLPAGRN